MAANLGFADLDELARFLVEAKLRTYASGQKGEKLPDGSERFSYRRADWGYSDTFFGDDVFGGQELVSHQGNKVWMMNYHGRMLSNEVPSKEVFAFLRSALKEVVPEDPYRGLNGFIQPESKLLLDYENRTQGRLASFVGKEIICLHRNDEPAELRTVIYELNYHGGLLQWE